MKLWLHLLTLLWLLAPYCLKAQDPVHWRLGTQEGLPDDKTYGWHQDSKGYIWFSNDFGLYRYDGFHFKRYFAQGYATSMGRIDEDKEGRIWTKNFRGQLFYIKNDQLLLFEDFTPEVGGFVTYDVSYFPKIIVTTDNGYLSIDFYTRKRQRYLLGDQWKSCARSFDTLRYKVKQTKIAGKIGKDLVMQRGGCFILCNDQGGKYILHQQDSFPFSIEGTFRPISGDTLILGLDLAWGGQLFNYSNNCFVRNNRYKTFLSSLVKTNRYYQAPDGKLYFATENGVVVTDTDFNIYQHFFKGKNIFSIKQDQEGNYWYMTAEYGIHIVPSLDFTVWNKQNSLLISDKIGALAKDDQCNLYIGLSGGSIYKLPATSQKLERLTLDEGNTLYKLHFDPYHKRLYASMDKRGYYDLKKSTWQHAINKIVPNEISFLDEENMLTASARGASIMTRKNGIGSTNPLDSTWHSHFTLTYAPQENIHALDLRTKRSLATVYDKANKRAWVAYVDGLYYYKDVIEEELKVNTKPILAKDIVLAQNGTIWLSTVDGGVQIIKDTIITASSKDWGWWDQPDIYGVATEGDTAVIATNKGLYFVNTKNYNHTKISFSEGYPYSKVKDVEVADSKVYLATFEGLYGIPVGHRPKPHVAPPISITNVLVNSKDTTLLSTYALSYNQNDLHVHFRGISYKSQGEFNYKFRLQGLNNDWINVDGSQVNIAYFPSLSPGSYTFEVKTVDIDGIESTHAATVAFHISPPFWLAWWFKVLIGMATLLAVYLIFLQRLRKVRKENRLKQESEQVKQGLISAQLTGLRSQMNPHFIFNALNSIQEYTYLNKKELAIDYLGKFADLTRLYLNQCVQQGITIQSEVKALALYLELEAIRLEKSLEYHINIHKDLNPEKLLIPPMLVQPHVENAIKHGLVHKKGKRQLTVEFKKHETPKGIYCSVQDNGIGRVMASKINKNRALSHKSFALSNTHRRLELLNKINEEPVHISIVDLYYNDKPNGTKVELLFPLKVVNN